MNKPPTRLLADQKLPATLRADLLRVEQSSAHYDFTQGLARLRETLANAPTRENVDHDHGSDSGARGPAPSKPSKPTNQTIDPLVRADQASPSAHGADAQAASVSVGSAGPGPGMSANPAIDRASLSAPAATSVSTLKSLALLLGLAGTLGLGAALLRPRPARPGAETHSAPATQAPTGRETTTPLLAPASSTTVDSAAARREIELMLRLRHLLLTDPAAAYRLAQVAERQFPQGALSEEREALSVLALAATGDRERARALARDFLRRHPDSPMRAPLQKLVSEQTAP